MSARIVLGYLIIILLIDGYFTKSCYISETAIYKDCPNGCCIGKCCDELDPETKKKIADWVLAVLSMLSIGFGIFCLVVIACVVRCLFQKRQSQRGSVLTTGNLMPTYPIQQTSFYEHPNPHMQYSQQHILQQQQQQQQDIQVQQQQLQQQQIQQRQELHAQQQQLQQQQQQLQQQQQHQVQSQYNQQQLSLNSGAVSGTNTSAKAQSKKCSKAISNKVTVNPSGIRKNAPLPPHSRTILASSDEC